MDSLLCERMETVSLLFENYVIFQKRMYLIGVALILLLGSVCISVAYNSNSFLVPSESSPYSGYIHSQGATNSSWDDVLANHFSTKALNGYSFEALPRQTQHIHATQKALGRIQQSNVSKSALPPRANYD